jgi:hypothetical protein
MGTDTEAGDVPPNSEHVPQMSSGRMGENGLGM